jgi:hypothetical protein
LLAQEKYYLHRRANSIGELPLQSCYACVDVLLRRPFETPKQFVHYDEVVARLIRRLRKMADKLPRMLSVTQIANDCRSAPSGGHGCGAAAPFYYRPEFLPPAIEGLSLPELIR